MATDIDDLPLYDGLIKNRRDVLSDVWMGSLSDLILTLQEYLSSTGISVPQLTTLERGALVDVTNGQLIYNTSDNKFQGYEAGVWTNLI